MTPPRGGALSDDAVWRLSVWRLSRTSGRRAACAAGRPAGWRVLTDRARLGRPGSRLPLRASVASLGGGISWRPPAYSLLLLLLLSSSSSSSSSSLLLLLSFRTNAVSFSCCKPATNVGVDLLAHHRLAYSLNETVTSPTVRRIHGPHNPLFRIISRISGSAYWNVDLLLLELNK